MGGGCLHVRVLSCCVPHVAVCNGIHACTLGAALVLPAAIAKRVALVVLAGIFLGVGLFFAGLE